MEDLFCDTSGNIKLFLNQDNQFKVAHFIVWLMNTRKRKLEGGPEPGQLSRQPSLVSSLQTARTGLDDFESSDLEYLSCEEDMTLLGEEDVNVSV